MQVIRYMRKLFAGCDRASFFHMKGLFEEAFPSYSFHVEAQDIVVDGHGLMTGEIAVR